MDDESSDSTNLMNKYCKYLNRRVVLTTSKSSHTGSLKCIDPLTQSIALIVTDPQAKTSKVVIAMSHSIKSVRLADDTHPTDDPNSDDLVIDLNHFLSTIAEPKEPTLSGQALEDRKQNVVKWLRKNRIPVEETDDGSLCIAFALTLSAPFGRDQCLCANEIVLHQIQTLLDTMPTT